jgi:hypothetical protein
MRGFVTPGPLFTMPIGCCSAPLCLFEFSALRFSDLTQRAQRKATESTESLVEGTYNHGPTCDQDLLFQDCVRDGL